MFRLIKTMMSPISRSGEDSGELDDFVDSIALDVRWETHKMSGDMRLFDMDTKEMQTFKRISLLGIILSLALNVIYGWIVPVLTGPKPPPSNPVLKGFAITEVAFEGSLFVVSIGILVLHALELQKPSSIVRGEQNIVFLVILAVSAFALPFRGIATLLQAEEIAFTILLSLGDAMAAIGSTLLFGYIWVYILTWSHQGERVGLRSLLLTWRGFLFLLSFSGRIAVSLFLRLHLPGFPIQNAFSALSLVSMGRGSVPLMALAVLCTSIVDLSIVISLLWDYRRRVNALLKAKDPKTHRSLIALKYLGMSIAPLLWNAVILSISDSIKTLAMRSEIIPRFGHVVTSPDTGSSAVSFSVLSYALRETFVHSIWRDTLFPSSFSKEDQFPPKPKQLAIETKPPLVYRMYDERDLRSNLPVPQAQAFSLESAILLFNMAWLATTYGVRGKKPLKPLKFGRPEYRVYQYITTPTKEVHVVIIEGRDRHIVSFKPVSEDIRKRNELVDLSQSVIGKALVEDFDDMIFDGADLFACRTRLDYDHRFSKAKLHKGYVQAYGAIRVRVLRALSGLCLGGGKPVFITGHSTAGPLAFLLNLDLCVRHVSSLIHVCSYVYGVPQFMNPVMVDMFEEQVFYRWRCVVAGDKVSALPLWSCLKHPSKVATFTRSGHMALEYCRSYKWWQSAVSAYPMHRLTSYYCAFTEWHKAYHMRSSLDLWPWPLDQSVVKIFEENRGECVESSSFMDSPTNVVESMSIRNLEEDFSFHTSRSKDEIIAFAR